MTKYRIHKEADISQPTLKRIAEGQPSVLTSTLEKLEALAEREGVSF